MKRLLAVTLLLFAVAWLALLASREGVAQENRPLQQQFRRYDIDDSGTITAAEWTDPESFARLDLDGDGQITLQEAREAILLGRLRGVSLPPPVRSNLIPPATASSQVRSDETDDVRQGPKPVKPSDLGVGRMVDDFEFTDVEGHSGRLADFRDDKILVIAMTGTGCPLCQKYAPTLARIASGYRDKGVRFVFINPNESESRERVLNAIETHRFNGAYIRDVDQRLSRMLDVKTTTEVLVLDAARTLQYRGAVDDQYGFGYALDAPRHSYLIDALEAVLRSERPVVTATTAPGCEMHYAGDDTAAEPSKTVTYHNRISRILMDQCVVCHRDGGSGPFSLEHYDSARDYAGMIGSVVRRGIMPPWFASPQDSDSSGLVIHWSNDRSLHSADREDLLNWIESGLPEGNAADAPLPRTYPDQWEIGEPDLVLQIPKPISIKASGRMSYQHARVETELTEDRWVQAVEIRPTSPAVVHHVLVFVQPPGADVREINEEAGFFAAYVPGNTFQVYPDGFAKLLPAGSRLVLQLHYTPNGTATSDQTRMAIRFASQPPKHEIRNTGISNHRIAIPPGSDNHLETASLDVPADVRLLALMPDMHLRGKAFRYDLVFPDGRRETLLDVPRYDFNWQLEYRLAEPLEIPRGSRFELSAWYDNSDRNPANPDSSLTVRWGPQTEDEMMLGYVEYVLRD